MPWPGLPGPCSSRSRSGRWGPCCSSCIAAAWRWRDRPVPLAANRRRLGHSSRFSRCLVWMAASTRWRGLVLAVAGLSLVGAIGLLLDARLWLDFWPSFANSPHRPSRSAQPCDRVYCPPARGARADGPGPRRSAHGRRSWPRDPGGARAPWRRVPARGRRRFADGVAHHVGPLCAGRVSADRLVAGPATVVGPDHRDEPQRDVRSRHAVVPLLRGHGRNHDRSVPCCGGGNEPTGTLPGPLPAPRRSTLERLWLYLAVALPALVSLLVPLPAIDLAYQVRAAGDPADRGIPVTDTWTFTVAGTPWSEKQWLAQVLLALGFQAGGWELLAVPAGRAGLGSRSGCSSRWRWHAAARGPDRGDPRAGRLRPGRTGVRAPAAAVRDRDVRRPAAADRRARSQPQAGSGWRRWWSVRGPTSTGPSSSPGSCSATPGSVTSSAAALPQVFRRASCGRRRDARQPVPCGSLGLRRGHRRQPGHRRPGQASGIERRRSPCRGCCSISRVRRHWSWRSAGVAACDGRTGCGSPPWPRSGPGRSGAWPGGPSRRSSCSGACSDALWPASRGTGRPPRVPVSGGHRRHPWLPLIAALPWWRPADPITGRNGMLSYAPSGIAEGGRELAPAGDPGAGAQTWTWFVESGRAGCPYFLDSRSSVPRGGVGGPRGEHRGRTRCRRGAEPLGGGHRGCSRRAPTGPGGLGPRLRGRRRGDPGPNPVTDAPPPVPSGRRQGRTVLC